MVVAEVCSSMKYPKRSQYKHAKQKKYHVRNWAEYNEGLRRRGDLTVWFDEEAIANWKADKTGKPGGQRVYSDMAIETGLVVRMVYKLAYRQTEGFLHSIASLLGLGIEILDYSTLCRRSRLLGVVAPLWLRAKSAYGGGRGMFEHEVSQALPVQAREAEEVPRSQLGGIQRRAAPPGRFDSLV